MSVPKTQQPSARSHYPEAANAGTHLPAYDVQSVRFRYRANESKDAGWVLNGVTFQVEEGEVLGIVGPNGSGKTSLLKLLAKIVSPQQGGLTLFGNNLVAIPQREAARLVAVVPQDSQQLFPFTVAETVLMGRFPHRLHNRWSLGFGWVNRNINKIY